MNKDTYWLTRITYLRAISFIYFVAFFVAYNQNKQLIGDHGLLPLKLHMDDLKNYAGGSTFTRFSISPTLLWLAEPWDEVDIWLDNIALAGMTLSLLVFVSGAANVLILLTLWILYHSLVNVGQRWYSFGWESQLLETGFLGTWCVPLLSLTYLPKNASHCWVTIWGLRWLIIRIMLGAGLIKIRGDKCWLDLTCMNYHYQTQPVPNPLSYYLHQAPETVHVLETLGNHIVELIIPFFGFLTRPFRITCGIIQILFQVILIISGNLSFLNWLTIVPSIAFFDDASLSFLFSSKTQNKVRKMQQEMENNPDQYKEGNLKKIVNVVVASIIGYLSLPVIINLLSSHQMMNTSYDPLRIVNTYGAFGSITKIRHEVIFEGTYSQNPELPDITWHEYEFKCKPGNVDRRPCLISPYHYRLDWLMWFAAFQDYRHNPWLVHLAGKFLINDNNATALIAHNPFEGKKPPWYIRALLYKYEYTKVGSKKALAGNWYQRKLVRTYLPPVDAGSLKSIFKRMRWQTLEMPK